MNHDRLESRPRIVDIIAASADNAATARSRGSLGPAPAGVAEAPGGINPAGPSSSAGGMTGAEAGCGLLPTRPGKRVSQRLATSSFDQTATTSGRFRRIT